MMSRERAKEVRRGMGRCVPGVDLPVTCTSRPKSQNLGDAKIREPRDSTNYPHQECLVVVELAGTMRSLTIAVAETNLACLKIQFVFQPKGISRIFLTCLSFS